MLSTKRLIKMATKWRKAAAEGRKRLIMLQRANSNMNSNSCNDTSSVANKGHFVVYTTDSRRFMIPLSYLNNDIFKALLRLSEEEFGLPRDGPITLPCDSFFLEHMVPLIRRGLAKDQDKAKLLSVVSACCSISSSIQRGMGNRNLLVCN